MSNKWLTNFRHLFSALILWLFVLPFAFTSLVRTLSLNINLLCPVIYAIIYIPVCYVLMCGCSILEMWEVQYWHMIIVYGENYKMMNWWNKLIAYPLCVCGVCMCVCVCVCGCVRACMHVCGTYVWVYLYASTRVWKLVNRLRQDIHKTFNDHIDCWQCWGWCVTDTKHYVILLLFAAKGNIMHYFFWASIM